MCLKGITDVQLLGDNFHNGQLRLVNKRSEAWHKVRNTAAVIRSTCYRALGFDRRILTMSFAILNLKHMLKH